MAYQQSIGFDHIKADNLSGTRVAEVAQYRGIEMLGILLCKCSLA